MLLLVGGEILDLALAQAKEHARFVMCGGISQYNAKVPQGPKVRFGFPAPMQCRFPCCVRGEMLISIFGFARTT